MGKFVIDTSDIGGRAKRLLEDDWIARLQYDDQGRLTYLSSKSGHRHIVTLEEDAGGNFLGDCTCSWAGRQKEGAVGKPCRHLCAAWLWETAEGRKMAPILFPSCAEQLAGKVKETAAEGSPPPPSDPDDDAALQEKRLAAKRALAEDSERKKSDSAKPHDPKIHKAKTHVVDPPIVKWTPRNTITIWPSSVPMLEACSASRAIEDDDVLIDRIGDPARLGRAGHALAEDLVAKEWTFPPQDLVEGIAARYGVPQLAEDLKFIGMFAAQAWHGTNTFQGVKRWFFNPNVEITREFSFIHTHSWRKNLKVKIRIRGRNDLDQGFPEEERGVVLDWKTGRRTEESNYSGQMMANAVLLAGTDKRIKSVTTIIVWLRDRITETVTYTRDELRAWLNEMVKYNVFWDGKTYGPGRHCRYCQRMPNCPGRRAELQGNVGALVATDSDLITPIVDENGVLIPDRTIPMWQHLRMVKDAADAALAQLKEMVEEQGGVILPNDDTKELATVEFQGRLNIDPIIAWPILERRLTQQEFADAITIGVSKVKNALAAKTEPGKKGKVIDDVMAELDAAGALSRNNSNYRLQVRKREPNDALEGDGVSKD